MRTPAVPTTVSMRIAAIVPGPSNWMTCSRWARARSDSSASEVGPERGAVRVRAEEVHVAVGVLVGPAAGVAGRGHRGAGVAVVAAVEAEHLVLAGVDASHPDRVLVGVGAAVGEEDLVEAGRGQLGDALGGLAADVVGVLRRDRRELGGLLLDRGDDLRVLVTDVDVDQLAGEVEVAGAVVVPDVGPLGPGDGQRVERGLGAPRVEDVRAVEGDDLGTAGGVRGGLGHRGLLGAVRVLGRVLVLVPGTAGLRTAGRGRTGRRQPYGVSVGAWTLRARGARCQ